MQISSQFGGIRKRSAKINYSKLSLGVYNVRSKMVFRLLCGGVESSYVCQMCNFADYKVNFAIEKSTFIAVFFLLVQKNFGL